VILPKRIKGLAFIVSGLLLIPFSALIGALFSPSSVIWRHVRDTLLPTYLTHTLAVLTISVLLATLIGGSLGMLFARKRFAYQKVWRIGLILPLAIPSYVYAMIYADLFSVTGFIGRTLWQFDASLSLAWMNVPGVSVMFALALYPYVFLITESTVRQHGTHYETAASQLGASKWRIFGPSPGH
jgi:iron(III) transport system permease protein